VVVVVVAVVAAAAAGGCILCGPAKLKMHGLGWREAHH